MKYVYIFLISFVFWEFGWQSYSTLYGMIIAFGVPDINILNWIVKIALIPAAIYCGTKLVNQEITRRQENRKEEQRAVKKATTSK